MNENIIAINKYLYFDKDSSRFCLTNEASHIIYREKNIICSYSGANEWCNHFVCELIDLYTGASKFNYALGTTEHEKAIPKLKKDGVDVDRWIEESFESEEWAKHLSAMFVNIIDDLIPCE